MNQVIPWIRSVRVANTTVRDNRPAVYEHPGNQPSDLFHRHHHLLTLGVYPLSFAFAMVACLLACLLREDSFTGCAVAATMSECLGCEESRIGDSTVAVAWSSCLVPLHDLSKIPN